MGIPLSPALCSCNKLSSIPLGIPAANSLATEANVSLKGRSSVKRARAGVCPWGLVVVARAVGQNAAGSDVEASLVCVTWGSLLG